MRRIHFSLNLQFIKKASQSYIKSKSEKTHFRTLLRSLSTGSVKLALNRDNFVGESDRVFGGVYFDLYMRLISFNIHGKHLTSDQT